MKRKLLVISSMVLMFAQPVCAEDFNPFFRDTKHQVAFNVSLGVDSGIIVPPPIRFVPFTEFHLQYSVPSTMFFFPARLSLNVSQMVGYGKKYGWDWRDFTIPILYLSQDVVLFHGKDWYSGVGAGMGFQVNENERIGSKLVFTFKVFFGYKFSDAFGAEIYAKHFSNGNTGHENNSYGFWGVGVTYNF